MLESEEPNAAAVTKQLKDMGIADISEYTVHRRIRDADIFSMTPAKKPLLSNKNIKARLELGLKYQEWTVDDWRKVLFSDETKVNWMDSDGRKYTWKGRNEPLQRKHLKNNSRA